MLAVALVPYLLTVVPVRWRWTVVLAGGVCAYGVWTSGSRAALVVTVVALRIEERGVRAIVSPLATRHRGWPHRVRATGRQNRRAAFDAGAWQRRQLDAVSRLPVEQHGQDD